MPVTASYDLSAVQDNNDRNYIRSMFERFSWRRMGGSVFRYDGVLLADGSKYEDWLNHVVPALMFLRSFLIRKGIQLRFFTIDASGVSFLDHSDPASLLGTAPQTGAQLLLVAPTNAQSSEQVIRDFVDAAVNATPAPAAPAAPIPSTMVAGS